MLFFKKFESLEDVCDISVREQRWRRDRFPPVPWFRRSGYEEVDLANCHESVGDTGCIIGTIALVKTLLLAKENFFVTAFYFYTIRVAPATSPSPCIPGTPCILGTPSILGTPCVHDTTPPYEDRSCLSR